MKGVLLHGGAGTRLRPLTFTGPKQLIPVANKPVSQYCLEDMIGAGIKEVAIILGETYPEMVEEHYGDGSRFGCKITYIHQGKPLAEQIPAPHGILCCYRAEKDLDLLLQRRKHRFNLASPPERFRARIPIQSSLKLI